MTAFIRHLFAARTASAPAPARKVRLSLESLDERLAPAVLTTPVVTETTAAQTRNAIPGTCTPAGTEQEIGFSGGHTGATRGIGGVGG